MTEANAHALRRDATKGPSWLALALILIGFPLAIAQVDLIPAAEQFLRGDRQHWLVFWGYIIAVEWTFFALVLIALSFAKRPLREVGLAPPGPITAIVLAILIALAIAAAVLLPGVSDAALREAGPGGMMMFVPPADTAMRLFWVFCSLTAGICEEALFRGVAIGELRRTGMHALVAALISCLVFAYVHGGLDQGAVAFGGRFVVGALFALLYLRLKSIWPGVAIHFAIDASILLMPDEALSGG